MSHVPGAGRSEAAARILWRLRSDPAAVSAFVEYLTAAREIGSTLRRARAGHAQDLAAAILGAVLEGLQGGEGGEPVAPPAPYASWWLQ